MFQNDASVRNKQKKQVIQLHDDSVLLLFRLLHFLSPGHVYNNIECQSLESLSFFSSSTELLFLFAN